MFKKIFNRVDTYIPGVEKVGGFSMCSSPERLRKTGMLTLAVKHSTHPPALWVHEQCSVGDKVELRVGGDYCYDPRVESAGHSLLLVAGGVGINPLMSMVEHVTDCRTESNLHLPVKVELLFSAKTLDELLFKKRIEHLTSDWFATKFFITSEVSSTNKPNYYFQRISEEDIQQSLHSLSSKNVLCYLCGPSPMIEDVEKILHSCNIAPSNIHYEKWW